MSETGLSATAGFFGFSGIFTYQMRTVYDTARGAGNDTPYRLSSRAQRGICSCEKNADSSPVLACSCGRLGMTNPTSSEGSAGLLLSSRAERGICSCALPAQFPGLGILPRHVYGVVEVQQQAFPAIQKSEAEEVVVNERC